MQNPRKRTKPIFSHINQKAWSIEDILQQKEPITAQDLAYLF